MPFDQSAENVDAEIRRVCSILESIANQYAPSSPEHRAMQDAAAAFIMVHQWSSLRAAFCKWKSAMAGDIPAAMWDDMADRLRSLGIDPDGFDGDHGDGRADE